MSDYTLSMRLFNAQQGYQALVTAFTHAKAWLTSGQRLIVDIRPETRSDAQNRLLHALIGDVSKQAQWMGKRRTPAEWKVLFVSGHAIATKHGADLVPGLEGEFCNIRESTARMSKARVNSLIEYIYAWGSAHDVVWQEAEQWMVDADTGEILEAA